MKPKLKRPKILSDSELTEIAFRQIDQAINDAASVQRFRGEIYDFFKDVPMERGYANKGDPFDINTACYMREPMQEIRRRTHGKFVFRAAVQMLKTLGTIEQPAGYFIANDPGDMAVYLFGDDSAFDQAKARIMPYIKSEPTIARMIDRVINASGAGRFDIRTAEFYLPGMVLRIWPANESSTQRITLRYVLVSDAFLSKKTGILKQAIARSTQHNSSTLKDYKVIIESQGGEDEDDFDIEWKSTDQRMLHVRCPYCGEGQPFEWHRERLDDFKATLPKSVLGSGLTPEQLESKVAELTKELTAADRKDCGMKRGPDALIKKSDCSYDEKQVLKLTYYECYHCGSHWQDTPEIRRIIDESSYYVASNTNALPENVGFSWPAWAGQRLAWGGEQNMLEYLRSNDIYAKWGNIEPLKQWYQKRAAKSWNNDMTKKKSKPSFAVGSYETNPENLSYGVSTMRQMTVDTGKSPESDTNVIQIGQLFFEIRDFDNGPESLSRGASRQITRGMVQDCVMDTPDGRRRVSCWELLAAQQHYWRITNRHVLIDLGYAPSQVIEAAVKFHEIVDLNGNPVFKENYGKQVDWASCWRGCHGSADSRIGPSKKSFHESAIPGLQSTHDKSGRMRKISLSRIIWSNYAFEDQFERIVMLKTAAVGWEILSQEKLVIVGLDGKPNPELTGQYLEFEQDREGSGQFRSWVSGLNSRTLDDKKRKYIDNSKQAYAKGHWTEPRDCSLMQLVGAAADGMLGHVATEE